MFIAMGELILHHYDKSIEWNGPYYHLQLSSSVLSPQHSMYLDVQYMEGEFRWSTSSKLGLLLNPT